MVLSDRDIKQYIEAGLLKIEPFKKEQIEPASIDLRLGNSFSVLKHNTNILTFDKELKYEIIKTNTYILEPHEFILATTMEYIEIKGGLTAFVEGRSSIGRIGLFVENAGWVDPGFEGEITLELYNASNKHIELQSGRRICQLVFAKTVSIPYTMYSGKYVKQKGATGTKIYQDREVNDFE